MALALVEEALSHLSTSGDDRSWDEDDALTHDRTAIERFVYGAASAQAVGLDLDLEPAEVPAFANRFRERFMSIRDGVLISAGPINVNFL